MNLEDLSSKSSIISDFFSWLYADERIIDKNIELHSEFDISLAPYYMDPNIYFPRQFNAFFNTRSMQRLGRISQLSLVIDTFPNTYNNRLEHSKGAYNRKLEEYLYSFQNESWKKYIENNNLKLYIIGDLLKMAGHDIGHFPLSHAFEEEIYNSHEAHDEIGKRIMCEDEEIQSVYESISPDLSNVIRELYERDVLNINNHNEGSYDVDRLDYLSRDTLYIGHPEKLLTQKYERTPIFVDEDGNIGENSDGSIVEDKTSNKFIDVYSSESLSEIEKLLRLRFSMYENCYMSTKTKTNECIIGSFFDALLANNSNVGIELKNFIINLKSQDISNADLSDFKKWDDIRLFTVLLDIAENHEDKNIRDLATMVIPTMDSLLNMLYSHFNIHSKKDFSKDDMNLLRKIKVLIKSNSELARNLRNNNFISENTLVNKGDSLLPNSKFISTFSYVLKAYKTKEPIYIKSKDGKIYELSKHPNRECDWQNKRTLIQAQYAYIPYLRLCGISAEDINQIELLFKNNSKENCSNTHDSSKLSPRVNMQQLQVGHKMEDVFLEL